MHWNDVLQGRVSFSEGELDKVEAYLIVAGDSLHLHLREVGSTSYPHQVVLYPRSIAAVRDIA